MSTRGGRCPADWRDLGTRPCPADRQGPVPVCAPELVGAQAKSDATRSREEVRARRKTAPENHDNAGRTHTGEEVSNGTNPTTAQAVTRSRTRTRPPRGVLAELAAVLDAVDPPPASARWRALAAFRSPTDDEPLPLCVDSALADPEPPVPIPSDPVPGDPTQGDSTRGQSTLDGPTPAESSSGGPMSGGSSGLRGPQEERLLGFQSGDVRLDVQVDGDGTSRTVHGLAEPACGEVEVRWPDGSARAELDRIGWFLVTGVPAGPVRLLLHRADQPSYGTDWFVC